PDESSVSTNRPLKLPERPVTSISPVALPPKVPRPMEPVHTQPRRSRRKSTSHTPVPRWRAFVDVPMPTMSVPSFWTEPPSMPMPLAVPPPTGGSTPRGSPFKPPAATPLVPAIMRPPAIATTHASFLEIMSLSPLALFRKFHPPVEFCIQPIVVSMEDYMSDRILQISDGNNLGYN